MTAFSFTLEELRSAPPEVRRWIENEILAAITAAGRPEHDFSQVHAAALASCTLEEASQIFDLIKGNFLLTQIFFELAREVPDRGSGPLHALDIGAVLRHTRLSDGDQLAGYLSAINQTFQKVRNDPEAALFGFDQYGHVYVHEATHKSVRSLWEHFVAAHPPASAGAMEAPPGFALPHLGPSEAVAGHHAVNPGSLVF